MVSILSYRNKRTITLVVLIIAFMMICFQLKRNHTKQLPAKQPPAKQPLAKQPPAKQPLAKQPPAKQPPAKQPLAKQPPAKQPPAKQPLAKQPPAKQQRCYEFHYNYPLNNVKDILNELKDNGTTSSQPINHIYNQYSTIYNVKCAAYTELIILVKSYIGHFDQRKAIRSTWGTCHGENVRVVFLLGYSSKFDEQVRYEYAEYNDIVQGSFKDEYRNNIYKTLMTYDWVVSNCSDSQFVFFVDDDYFVTIPNLLQFSREKIWDGTDVMFGHKQCNPENPVRSKSSRYRKWYISEEEYQPPVLPPFLSGGSVLTHINVVRTLRIAFPYMKTIFLDDVYVSLVAQKIGINILHDERFVNAEVRRMDFNFIISCHNFNSSDYLNKAWLKFKTANSLHCNQ